MWAQLLPVMLQFLMAVPQLVATAETAFSGRPGSGAAKKDLVLSVVNQGLRTYQHMATHKLPANQVAAIQGTANVLVDSTVALLNASQVMPHTTIETFEPTPPVYTVNA